MSIFWFVNNGKEETVFEWSEMQDPDKWEGSDMIKCPDCENGCDKCQWGFIRS